MEQIIIVVGGSHGVGKTSLIDKHLQNGKKENENIFEINSETPEDSKFLIYNTDIFILIFKDCDGNSLFEIQEFLSVIENTKNTNSKYIIALVSNSFYSEKEINKKYKNAFQSQINYLQSKRPNLKIIELNILASKEDIILSAIKAWKSFFSEKTKRKRKLCSLQ